MNRLIFAFTFVTAFGAATALAQPAGQPAPGSRMAVPETAPAPGGRGAPALPVPKMNMAGANSSGGNSAHETTSGTLGPNRVTVTYGRPYSMNKDTGEIRKIFGELVPWDKADRMGSDEATTLITQQPLMIGTARVPAGIYTLYWVLSEKGASKLAISTNVGKWGVPVDESKDLARVDLTKEPLAITLPSGAVFKQMNQLTIMVSGSQDGTGTLRIIWENTQFSVALKNAQ